MLAMNAPNGRIRERGGRIVADSILGGLHHRYRRPPEI
jgi:hypothetical protein